MNVFYSYEPARKFLGIEFDDETGELIILLPQEEFEIRLLEVFKILIDAERFSRDFNKDDDKKKFINQLNNNPKFDFSVTNEEKKESKSSKKKSDLEEKKKKVTRRRKSSKKKSYQNRIILADKEIIFDNEKLDELFAELKHLPIDKIYSFAILLRTYLEQSLYYYLREKELFEDLSSKTNSENKKNNLKKVNNLMTYIKNKYSVQDEIEADEIMSILRFNSKKDYSSPTLKVMLDYIKNHELENHLDTNQLKNLKHYIDRIKDGLDLAVHNIETIVDLEHNKRAWKHLEPLFDILSSNLYNEE